MFGSIECQQKDSRCGVSLMSHDNMYALVFLVSINTDKILLSPLGREFAKGICPLCLSVSHQSREDPAPDVPEAIDLEMHCDDDTKLKDRP